MKKTILIFAFILTFYIIVGSASSKILIPNDALRVRVIANSNDYEDQYIKFQVKDNLSNYLYNTLKEANNVDAAKQLIQTNLTSIEKNIANTLHINGVQTKYDVNFGLNYFPSKKYKGVKYQDGFYESLVVTIGEGKGDNWWCVMFPPLCLLEAEESTEVEYQSYVKELINKYF